MKSKNLKQQQLQITSLIKDPATLKLLILTGTKIKPHWMSTISRCKGLIKLDLTNNQLQQLNLDFHCFPNLKILYLHDNRLSHVDIKGQQIQYITLFKNVMQAWEYRKIIIKNNPTLLAIDFNTITSKQKYNQNYDLSNKFTQIKWPIVEMKQSLQREQDYLNLIKAQIFIIMNIYQKASAVQTIQYIFQGIIGPQRYFLRTKQNPTYKYTKPNIINTVQKWKYFTMLKKKLFLLLQNKHKQYLLLNKMERKKKSRSTQVTRVLQKYIKYLRKRIKARRPFAHQLNSYRRFLSAQNKVYEQYLFFNQQRDYQANPVKLYFRQSQLPILSKICLFAKKIFFTQKSYQLCEQFINLFKQTNKKYYIFRSNSSHYSGKSWILNTIHSSSGYVLRQIGINRKNILYGKHGHKFLTVKPYTKPLKLTEQQVNKIKIIDKKLQQMYESYDKLIQYQVKSLRILKQLLKLIKFLNTGLGHSIILTQTSYFQTQILHKSQQNISQTNQQINFTLQHFASRIIATNIIQKFWRRIKNKNKNINVIQIIQQQRAQHILSKWLRNLIFNHRLSSIKHRSYLSSIWKQKQLYFQLEIYLNMPPCQNILRFPAISYSANRFYDILHKGTQIQIVHAKGRKWVRINYNTTKQAYNAQIQFYKYTYCYRQGFYLKLWTGDSLQNQTQLNNYQFLLFHLFKIKVIPLPTQQLSNVKTITPINNTQPFFIWSQIHAQQHNKKFQHLQKNNLNICIFIYNKQKKPLKVSCDFYWATSNTLYNRTTKPKRFTVQKTPLLYLPLSLPQSPTKIPKPLYNQNTLQSRHSILELEQYLKKNQNSGVYHIELSKKMSNKKLNSLVNSMGTNLPISISKSHRTKMRRVSEGRVKDLSSSLLLRRK